MKYAPGKRLHAPDDPDRRSCGAGMAKFVFKADCTAFTIKIIDQFLVIRIFFCIAESGKVKIIHHVPSTLPGNSLVNDLALAVVSVGGSNFKYQQRPCFPGGCSQRIRHALQPVILIINEMDNGTILIGHRVHLPLSFKFFVSTGHDSKSYYHDNGTCR
jgi:hypothetical protein